MDALRRCKHNKKCVDCDVVNRFGSPAVVWSLRTFVCTNCAEAHRAIWAEDVKLVNEYEWSEMDVQVLLEANGGGNKCARKKWYGRYDKARNQKPKPGDPSAKYLEWIKKIYMSKAFFLDEEARKKAEEARAAAKAKKLASEKNLIDMERDLMDHDDRNDMMNFAAPQGNPFAPAAGAGQMVLHPMFNSQEPLGSLQQPGSSPAMLPPPNHQMGMTQMGMGMANHQMVPHALFNNQAPLGLQQQQLPHSGVPPVGMVSPPNAITGMVGMPNQMPQFFAQGGSIRHLPPQQPFGFGTPQPQQQPLPDLTVAPTDPPKPKDKSGILAMFGGARSTVPDTS